MQKIMAFRSSLLRFKRISDDEPEKDYVEREINIVEKKLNNLGYMVEVSVKADHLEKLKKERLKESKQKQ